MTLTVVTWEAVQVQIFVNYRTGDEAFAAILLDEKLVDRFGAENVFRCGRSIQLGEEFTGRLWTSLAAASVLLAVIGPRWLTAEQGGQRRLDAADDFVRREIAFALGHGLRVIPVLVGDTRLPAAAELPPEIEDLARRQYFRVFPRSAHRDLRLLGDELAALLWDGAAPSRPPARPHSRRRAPTHRLDHNGAAVTAPWPP